MKVTKLKEESVNRCDYCGKEGSDMMPSFWSDKTRWFCGIDCLRRFRAIALGSLGFDEDALDGKPGTAKVIFESEERKRRKNDKL